MQSLSNLSINSLALERYIFQVTWCISFFTQNLTKHETIELPTVRSSKRIWSLCIYRYYKLLIPITRFNSLAKPFPILPSQQYKYSQDRVGDFYAALSYQDLSQWLREGNLYMQRILSLALNHTSPFNSSECRMWVTHCNDMKLWNLISYLSDNFNGSLTILLLRLEQIVFHHTS